MATRIPRGSPGRVHRVGAAVLRAVRLRHPAQLAAAALAFTVAAGTLLLALPIARRGEGGAPAMVAFFTATSAVTVIGHVVVDTGTYWTPFGKLVVIGLIQAGGFGIMTVASLLGLLVSHRLGLRTRLTAQAETKALALGDVRRVLRGVATVSLTFEAAAALVLTGWLWVHHHEPPGPAAGHGGFLAVSAFNNAGFSPYRNNLVGFVTDPVVTLVVAVAVIAGGLGFPVLFELRRGPRAPRRWSLHTKITVYVSAALLAAGTWAVTSFEWTNPRTLGPLTVPGKLLAGFFQAVSPRTAGFNSVDYGGMNEPTLLVTDALMFVGGGSAGTAGGIKVTTFALLGFVVLAEARGEQAVNVAGRRVPAGTQRQALSVALIGTTAVAVSTMALLASTRLDLDRVLFEVVSAFGTVGLSTGITAGLPASGKLILVALMFVGRLGPVTLASALALRQRALLYRLPEERPLVG